MSKDIKTMGSLANKLLGYVSTTTVHDTNYEIAVALIKNYTRLREMSIGEIADLCYVSKASISRFCRFMGFDSFKEFNSYLQQDPTINTDYSRSFYIALSNDWPDAISYYLTSVIENLTAALSPENIAMVPEIIQILHNSHHVAYFSHHFLWDIGRHFQNKMMAMGCYVEQFWDYSAQLECARSLGPDDLAIVCSIGGSYPLRYPTRWNTIISGRCKILAITQNVSSPYWNYASYILRCGNSNQNDTGKYAALLTAEMLCLNYLKQYGKDVF